MTAEEAGVVEGEACVVRSEADGEREASRCEDHVSRGLTGPSMVGATLSSCSMPRSRSRSSGDPGGGVGQSVVVSLPSVSGRSLGLPA